jgi:hypothetical protein
MSSLSKINPLCGASFPIDLSASSDIVQGVAATLETEYLSDVTALDLTTGCDFADYLAPNERHPARAKPHLVWDLPGLLVSTGTVRSLFDLIMADSEKCTGLVMRDINPKVKAYMDFEILLIRLSANHREYQELATPEEPGDFTQRPPYLAKLEKVRQLLAESDMPEEMKQYYAHHLETMAKLYFTSQTDFRYKQCWKTEPSFDEVNYYQRADLFDKLHKYAKEGKIIATVGSIDDLEFLGDANIGFVDISNIPDYELLNFKTRRVPEKVMSVWSCGSYNAQRYQPLSSEELVQFSSIYEIMREMAYPKGMDMRFCPPVKTGMLHYFHRILYHLRELSGKTDYTPCYVCKSFFQDVCTFKERYLYQLSESRWIDFSRILTGDDLNKIVEDLGEESFRKFVKEHAPRLSVIKDFLLKEEPSLGKKVEDILEEESSKRQRCD